MSARSTEVRAYLRAQAAAMAAGDVALRAHAPDAVHKARVAARRVRSLLRVFPRLRPELGADALEDELRAWSDRLGAVRDAEVLRATLLDACEGQLRVDVERDLSRRYDDGWAALLAELDTAAHAELVAAVTGLALAAPDRLQAGRRAKKAHRAAQRRLDHAGEDTELIHRARKAAKRARYAAEAIGDDRRVTHWRDVQDQLGTHHDQAVAIEALASYDGPEADAARERLAARAAAALA
jgi:CHAD domain-containing protein